ncbi:MAG: type II secretion system F family protein [Chloroflexota bacterium]
MLDIQLLLSLVIGFSVLAFFTGVRSLVIASRESDDRLQELLQTAAGSAAPTLRQLEMRTSFYHRAVKPVTSGMLKLLGRLAPQRNIDQLHRKLETAGFPGNLGVVDFLGLKILCGLLLGAAIVLLVYLARPDLSFLVKAGLGLLLGLVGFLFPNYWLSTRISARQNEILKALPDALDMMTIAVDAGLGLSGAMQRICDNWNNALIDEFVRVLAETRLGRSRTEALEQMGQRTGVKEVISFVTALTLAEKLGANIANVLHIQAEQMRIARRQKAEQLAREASIKMLFPLVFLIFPAMFAVILGPAVPQLLETFGSL